MSGLDDYQDLELLEESLEITETESSKGIHPLLIPHVVQNILEKFKDNEIFGWPRLVCSVWNHEVIRSLRLRSSRDVFLISGFDSSFYELCLPMKPKVKKKNQPSSIDIKKLCQLLQSSQNPDIILKSVFAKFDPDMAKCKSMLQSFGRYIKRLTYESNIKNLQSCLTQFCPNLESLHIGWQEEQNSYFDFEIPSNSTLKLKELVLSGDGNMDDEEGEGGDWSDLNECLSTFTAVLNASPLLEVLHIGGMSKSSFKNYFSAMSSVPHITNQLKSIHFDGDFMKNLDLLNSIQFGKNLKNVILNSEYEDEYEDGEEELASRHPKFVQFLSKIAGSIECLKVNGIVDGMPFLESNGYADLPKFPMLKSLSIEAAFTSLNFVSKMPTLEKLTFTITTDEGTVDQILLDTSRQSNKLQMLNIRYDSYNEYKQHQLVDDTPRTIELLNNAFPNICNLGLELLPPEESFKEWTEKSFKNISQMINLKNLSLLLDSSTWTKALKGEDDNFEIPFENLKNTPNLENLKLVKLANPKGHIRSRNRGFYQCSSKPLLKLVGCSKLRKLELVGLHISKVNKFKLMPQNPEEVEAFLEFRRAFERNGIILTITGAYDEYQA